VKLALGLLFAWTSVAAAAPAAGSGTGAGAGSNGVAVLAPIHIPPPPKSQDKPDPKRATFTEFIAIVEKTMDTEGDQLCACKDLKCAQLTGRYIPEHGLKAGRDYALSKPMTEDTRHFFVDQHGDGRVLLRYLEANETDWVKKFTVRTNACIKKLSPAPAPGKAGSGSGSRSTGK
jgi:hypothetical protein